jgi:NTE family protein
MRNKLRSTIAANDFDGLPIPFRCVATDLANGDPVIFNKGDLASAIRASASVPGVFQPTRVQGKLLVDGGVANNVPISVAREMGAVRLIVVDVGTGLVSENQLNSPLDVTSQVINTLVRQQTAHALATLTADDVLIRPELGDFPASAFERTSETFVIGEKAANAVVDSLRAFKVSEEEYATFSANHHLLVQDEADIDYVEFDTTRSRTARLVKAKLGPVIARPPYHLAAIEKAVTQIYGEGRYERISLRIERKDGKRGVKITPVDKGWGPNFLRFGLSLTDDLQGNASYQFVVDARATGLNANGGEWRNRLQLGRVAGLRTEFYQPFGESGNFYLRPYAEVRAQNQQVRVQRNLGAEYRYNRLFGGIEVGLDVDDDLQLYGGLERGNDDVRLRLGPRDVLPDLSSDYGAVFLGLTRDTLNDASFPTHGSRVEVRHDVFLSALGASDNGSLLQGSWDKALRLGKNRFLFGGRVGMTLDDSQVLQTQTLLGGLGNLSGFSERALFGRQAALGRLIYYRPLAETSSLVSTPVYFGLSAEAGNVWADRNSVDLRDLIGAGSVFIGADTLLGPIFFAYGRADTGDEAFYLNFGSFIRPLRQ